TFAAPASPSRPRRRVQFCARRLIGRPVSQTGVWCLRYETYRGPTASRIRHIQPKALDACRSQPAVRNPMTTTAKRLWIGFGVLTALLVLFSAVVLSYLGSVYRDVQAQAEVARPRAMLAKQLEIGLLGHALAVRTFFQTGDAKYREAAAQEAADVEQQLRDYDKLAITGAQKELA